MVRAQACLTLHIFLSCFLSTQNVNSVSGSLLERWRNVWRVPSSVYTSFSCVNISSSCASICTRLFANIYRYTSWHYFTMQLSNLKVLSYHFFFHFIFSFWMTVTKWNQHRLNVITRTTQDVMTMYCVMCYPNPYRRLNQVRRFYMYQQCIAKWNIKNFILLFLPLLHTAGNYYGASHIKCQPTINTDLSKMKGPTYM